VESRGLAPEYGLFAANPPDGCTALWGGERQNGLPYAERVRYVRDRVVLLSVRTVLPEPDPPPVIGTVEDFGTALRGFRRRPGGARPVPGEIREEYLAVQREDAETPAVPVVITVDGVEVAGVRKDFADCSVALLEPGGLRVYCVAGAALLDRLVLRSPAGRG
jgi:hypothetical protein